MRILSLFVLSLLLMSTPAHAAVSQADTTKFKTVMEAYFNHIVTSYKAQGMNVTSKGNFTAENKESYIAFKTPHLSFRDDSGTVIDMGVYSFNAIPSTNAGQWNLTMSIPTPFMVTKKGEKPGEAPTQYTISIPKQSTSGVFDEGAQNFVVFKGALSDITLTSSANKGVMKIASLDVNQNFSKGPNNLFSGPATATMRNLTFTGPEGEGSFTIGGVRADVTYSDLDFQAQKAFQDKFTALAESQNALTGKAGVSPQHGMALYKTVTDALTKSSSGFTTQFEITDISGSKKNKQTGAPEKFTLGKIGFGWDMTGLKTNSAGLAFRASLNGFTAPSTVDLYGISNPQAINIDMRLKNLPLQELTALGQQVLESTSASPDAASVAGLQAMMTLPGILTKASTGLDINDFSIQSAEYSGKLTGNFITNANAAKGVTGKMLGRVTGLDGVLAKLKAGKAKATTAADQQNLEKALKSLTVLQAMGQQDANGDRTYDIQINEQGQTLVNGADFSVLTGGGAP